jgi:putative Mg2+ transporter-C (MgtC) family protein
MPTVDAADAFLRLTAAGACGALIGLERESRNQLAGMRTHALVAAGAALFTLGGAYGFPEMQRGANVDPMRVAAQIASGIGFIGAGAIIRDRGSVRGVTTAASLWTSGALGMAAGAGVWWPAAAGAAVTLLILVGLRPIRSRITPLHTVDVEYERGHGTLAPVMDAIRRTGAELDDLAIRDADGGSIRAVTIDVRVHDPGELGEVAESLSALPEVTRCVVHRRAAYGRPSQNGAARAA